MSPAEDHPPEVSPTVWRTIFRHSDPAKVEAVWLAIRSMEYPARLVDRAGPIPVHEHPVEDSDDGSEAQSEAQSEAPSRGERPHDAEPQREPTHVEVHAEHSDELAEVIDEIVGEQDELDAAIEQLTLARQRRQRVIVAVIAVGFFAVILGRRLFA